MTVVDLNVLLYAVNSSSRQHPVARGWLESAIASHEPTGLTWTVLLGFLRLTTRPGILPRPLRVTTRMRSATEVGGRYDDLAPATHASTTVGFGAAAPQREFRRKVGAP